MPVAFHVNYWDYLGWRDLFGAADHIERQRGYSAQWKCRSVYTPGFVIDDKEWRGWFSREELPRASSQPAGKLTASSDDGKQWSLRFEPVAGNSKGNNGTFQTELILTPSSRLSAKRLGVAVWITRHKDLQPLQAIGGWLPEKSLQSTH